MSLQNKKKQIIFKRIGKWLCDTFKKWVIWHYLAAFSLALLFFSAILEAFGSVVLIIASVNGVDLVFSGDFAYKAIINPLWFLVALFYDRAANADMLYSERINAMLKTALISAEHRGDRQVSIELVDVILNEPNITIEEIKQRKLQKDIDDMDTLADGKITGNEDLTP